MRRGQVEVRVEDLVLDGLSPLDRVRFENAFVQQLEGAVAEAGLRPGLESEPVLDGGELTIAADISPGELGRDVARRVAGTITQRPLGGRAL